MQMCFKRNTRCPFKDSVAEKNRLTRFSALLIALLFLLQYVAQGSAKRFSKSCNSDLCDFNNLVVKKERNGQVYLAGKNTLFQLSSDLVLRHSVRTGPSEGVDAINKILLIDNKNKRIIVCSSINHGLCELRSENDITNVLAHMNVNATAVKQYVAAGGDLSTVGFLASVDNTGQQYLFVGSSKTAKDDDQENVFTVSQRMLYGDNTKGNMFSVQLFQDGIYVGDMGLIMKKSAVRDDFLVTFIDGFHRSGTGYFVMTHPASISGSTKTESFVAQICSAADPRGLMRSYLELQLSCTANGITYRKANSTVTRKVGNQLATRLNIPVDKSMEVMFVSFEDSSGGSAVCLYPLYEIDNKFVDLLNSCMKDRINPPNKILWVQRDNVPCGQGRFSVSSPVCSISGIWDVAQFLQGDSFVKEATYRSSSDVVTAMEVATSYENTVVFLGTNHGDLLKFKVNSGLRFDGANMVYETTPIDEPSRLPVRAVELAYNDPNSEKTPLVYAMTPNSVVGLPLYECERWTDCSGCLGSGDPFCGWCTLESRCSSTERCRSSGFINSAKNCPTLTSTALSLSIHATQQMITLRAGNIPPMGANTYKCKFDQYTSANTLSDYNSGDKSTTIRCDTPSKSSVPPLVNSGFRNIPLSIIYNNKALVTTNFTYYNCSYHSSCMSCVESGFICRWCIYENTCVERDSDCKQVNSNSIAKDTSGCPQVSSFRVDGRDQSTFYLVDGGSSSIDLRGERLPASTEYQCEISVPGVKKWTVSAIRSSESVVKCSSVSGFVPTGARSKNATVTVRWKDNVAIDSTQPLTIVMFMCTLDTSENNCGTCLQSSEQWHCGWCDAKGLCTHTSEQCNNRWIKAQANQVCSNPRITSFSPTSANPGGSTTITLNGTNFDRRMKMRITVAGNPCTLKSADCCSAKCTVTSATLKSGNITLCVTDELGNCRRDHIYHNVTQQVFHFVQSRIDSLRPTQALCGWGTPITISGKNLDAGNNVLVSVAKQPCEVTRRTSKEIECRLPCGGSCSTSSGNRRRRHSHHRRRHRAALRRMYRAVSTQPNVWLHFDGVPKVPSTNGYVTFRNRTGITQISPSKSFYTGGIPLRVDGSNLYLIHDPHIRVIWQGTDYITSCTRITETKSLECLSPRVPRRSGSWPDAVYITSPDCSETQWTSGRLKYVAEPQVDMFDTPDQTKTFRNESIYISGTNLCPDIASCQVKVVEVRIGEKKCDIRRYDMDQIECLPPAADIGSYSVKVSIGGFSTTVGQLVYINEETINLKVVVPVALGLVLLVGVVVVSLICIYRRRMHASDQEVKNMQVQMVVMESKVAKVCKEAFAELQTDMSELDMLGSGVGIPYLDYRKYLLRVLFPDPSNPAHYNLLSNPLERSDSRASNRPIPPRPGMERFNKLLDNKVFMLCFIRTIERQRTFSMKDKSNVAGLLLIVLQNRLQYATEILEQLLSDLIQKNMESRNHPKLLLRRTESVAEKMLTHWFSMLLYRFVVECAGEPLFMLYRAIKQQVDKGPVDMFTSEARYSLSEDKLLRQTVDQDTVTLRVANYLSDMDQSEFAVKVLSCDSVSQVKRKVLDVAFLNVPYSRRPHPEEVDLEWRPVLPQGRASVLLRNEDSTSNMDGEWKQVNTLSHYKVTDGSLISVIPRVGSSMLNYSTNSKNSAHRHNGSGSRLFGVEGSNTSLPRYKQTSRSGTPTLPQDGAKPWHLVKQNDQDQRGEGDRSNKMVSEIYLTRLLTTKGTIQKFVDDLFETIFSVVQRGHALPLAVKHMFDFLDHQADIHGIADPDIVHTWKSNCLPLRFWVNLLKNPEFVFDIHKSAIVDCYLSVIAQAFMDSCSTAEYKYGKDSPSNKLLFAKDIPNYRNWVKTYYATITDMPGLNPKDMSAFLMEESRAHSYDFNTTAALQQLFGYVQKYSDEIMTALDADPEAKRQHLLEWLEDVCVPMNGAP